MTKSKRYGPPKGPINLVLETSTSTEIESRAELNIDIAVAQQIGQQVNLTQQTIQSDETQGETFTFKQFDDFYQYFEANLNDLPPYCRRLFEDKETLKDYWNAWFALSPAFPDQPSYIQSLFISLQFMKKMYRFRGGIALENLSAGYRKVNAIGYQKRFSIEFSSNRIATQSIDDYAVSLRDDEMSAPVDETNVKERFENNLVQLTTSQRWWWDCLIKRHQDSLPEGVACLPVEKLDLLLLFLKFVKEMDARGLNFDATIDTTTYKEWLDNRFSNAKDFQTTLSYIRTIINSAKFKGKNDPSKHENDVSTVWAGIPKLHVNASEVMTSVYSLPYSVVLPQMRIETAYDCKTTSVEKYQLSGYYTHTLIGDDFLDNLDDMSDEHFEAYLTRTIAASEYRYPVRFYLQAIQCVATHFPENEYPENKHLQRQLCCLLMRSTTGVASFCIEPWEETLKKWEKMLIQLKDFPLPNMTVVNMASRVRNIKRPIAKQIINDFYNLKTYPSLNVLFNILQVTASNIKAARSMKTIEQIESYLRQQSEDLNKLTTKYFGLALYDGMRFGDALDLKTHLQVVNHFCKDIRLEEISNPFVLNCLDPLAGELVRLISTFNLTAANLKEIYDQLPWDKNKNTYDVPNDYFIYALRQLSSIVQVCSKEGRCLAFGDLKKFITALSDRKSEVISIDQQECDEQERLKSQYENVETEVDLEEDENKKNALVYFRPKAYLKIADDLLRTDFEAFFPDTYFLPEVPSDVLKDISYYFVNPADEQMVLTFFERLKLSKQQIDYVSILDKIKSLYNILSAQEKSDFLANIMSPQGVDLPEDFSDKIKALLTRLLDPINGAKNRQFFGLFFKLKRNLPKSIQAQLTTNLDSQLHFWLNSHDSLLKTFYPLLPKTQVAELTVSALLRQQDMSNQQQIQEDLNEILTIYRDMRKRYPIVERSLWQFLSHYQKNSQLSATHIKDMREDLTTLKDLFDLFDKESAQDYVLSLCFHFNGLHEINGLKRTPQGLLAICNDSRFKGLADSQKKIFLMMLAKVLNQEKSLGKEDLERLMDKFTRSEIFDALELSYQGVPYPSLKKFLSWYEREDYSHATLAADLNAFSLKPCQRETGRDNEKDIVNHNGFHVDAAQQIALRFKGSEISEKEIGYLSYYTDEVRKLTPGQLLEKICEYRQQYRENASSSDQQLAALVAITAEFLYRAKGIDSPIAGSSYEINTTQYLAIYALLKTGSIKKLKDVMVAMGTGEGKSRCIAILNICGLAQGKTVDALTRSLELATRDYLEFHAFYREVTKKLCTKVNLLSANSSFDEYSIGGVNISDVSHRQRFVNRAIVSGHKDKVLDKQKTRRMISLDEADLFRLPHLENKYTLASAPDPDWQKMPWIYGAVMDFFAQNDSQSDSDILKAYRDLSRVDDDDDTAFTLFDKRFLDFVQSSSIDKKSFEELRLLARDRPHRLDELYLAAYQARQLEFGKALGFGIDINVEEYLLTGETSAVFPMADPSAKFSLGVQQCLSVRMNRYYDLLKKSQQFPESLSDWEKRTIEKESTLMERLSEGDSYFHVDVQRQTEYSTTARDLFETYEEGQIYCFSGTPTGADYEREELTLKGTHVLEVPRHLGLYREDRAVIVAKNADIQRKALVIAIANARDSGQPILLLCEDDKSARMQFDLLVEILGKDAIQFVSSNARADVLSEHVMKAGTPGMITVASEKFGRGTDIKLSPEASKSGGLCTLINYLPETERELEQMLSRSARFGEPGSTQLILNRDTLQARYGSNSLKRDFYLAPEEHFQKLIAKINRHKQCERAISECVDAFHQIIQDSVLEKIYPLNRDNSDKAGVFNQVRGLWGAFQEKRAVTWERHWTKIKEMINPEQPSITLINNELENYRTQLSVFWEHFLQECQSIMPEHAKMIANIELAPLKLSDTAETILSSPSANMVKKVEVPVRAGYEYTHDGKRIVYSKPFEKTRATLRGERKMFADLRAWWRNEGILFPNLSAFWAGKLTLFQALTCYGGTVWQFITNTDVSKLKQSKNALVTSGNAKQDITALSLNDVFKTVDVPHESMSPAVMLKSGLSPSRKKTDTSDGNGYDDESTPLLFQSGRSSSSDAEGLGDKSHPVNRG